VRAPVNEGVLKNHRPPKKEEEGQRESRLGGLEVTSRPCMKKTHVHHVRLARAAHGIERKIQKAESGGMGETERR